MPRLGWLRILLVAVLAFVSLGVRCPPGNDTKSAAEQLSHWADGWSGGVKSSRQFPNHISIPRPPAVDFGAFATSTAGDVDRSARDLGDAVDVVDYKQAKSVYCYWFGWYVETGESLPSQEEFPAFLLKYGFSRVLTGPPSKRLSDAAALFRNSIERAQNSSDAAANAATAAVCSLPG
jgi:hypothetical protein